ncbi:MAG: oligosaccharide flippase family protein [Candidatus Eisenbacteria bacterium]|nr:oligosaccharide flippase family protein [Candidatus Eisenbacteria bacterium]
MARFLKRQSISSSIGVVMSMTILQRVLSVLRQMVFTRMLGPSGVGALGLAVDTIMGTPLNIVTLGLPSSYARYVQQYERKGRLRDFFLRTMRPTLVLASIAAVGCLAFSPQVSALVFQERTQTWLVVVTALAIVPEAMLRHLRAGFAGMRMFFVTSSMDFFPVLVFSVLGAVLVLCVARTPVAAAGAQAIGSWTTALVFGGLLWKHLKSAEPEHLRIEEPDFVPKIVRYSGWSMLMPLELQLLVLVDRWMLVRLRGLHDVGIYTAAASVSAYVFLLGALTANVLSPNLSQMWEEGDRRVVMRRINFAVRATLLALLGVALFLLAVSPWVIPFICGKGFTESANLMWAFVMYHLFYSAFYVLGLYPLLIEKPQMGLLGVTMGLVADVGLNLLLTPRYGVTGAAISAFCSMAVIALVMLAQCTIFVLALLFLPALRSRRILLAAYAALILVILFTPWLLDAEEKALLKARVLGMLRRPGGA